MNGPEVSPPQRNSPAERDERHGPTARRSTGPDGFHIRAASFQPVRAAYLREVLFERLGVDPAGTRALVVGAGRGLLARDLARLGFEVAALDPDEEAVRLGRQACLDLGVPVEYEVGDAASLPFTQGSFDVALFTDTLEITANLDSVLAEASRVLKRGSVLLYDTVTPSVLSRLIYLGALQSWRWTRIAPPGRYAWERFREPGQLSEALAQHGLRSQDVRGFQPAGAMRLLRATLRARRGRIDDEDLARLAGMRLADAAKKPQVTYLGFAVKST